MHLCRTLVLLALLAATPAAAQGRKLPAKAEAGRALAERRCASCHRIRAGEPTAPDARAPSFQAIADAKGGAPITIYDWLRQPPEGMAHVPLRGREAQNVVAYIQSLRRDEGG
jgi:mono/diheme cytochrome c family protein